MDLDIRNMSAAVLKRNPGLAEKLIEAQGKQPKQPKYNNKIVYLDGHCFPSQKEANRYVELKWALQAGVITKLELQPKFLLKDGYYCYQTKEWIKPVHYVADFRVTYLDGSQLVIDTKGFRTDVYKLKIKIFREKYPDVKFREE